MGENYETAIFRLEREIEQLRYGKDRQAGPRPLRTRRGCWCGGG